VAGALRDAGYDVVALGITQDGCWLDASQSQRALAGDVGSLPALGGEVRSSLGVLIEADVNVLFPLVHGTWGEDGALQGLCEMLDLPYVGAGVAASALAMDKLLSKAVLERKGVAVVECAAVSRSEWSAGREDALDKISTRLGFPLFVKPAIGGSSVGVSKVGEPSGLAAALELALRFDTRALIERAIVGRELECSVLGYPSLEASAVGEIRPGREFYDYTDKYLEDGAELLLPAELEPELEAELRDCAVRAFAAVGGTGMARVDFLLDDTGLFVNEINTLPGFTSISMYPKLWEISGLPLTELVRRLVEEGIARHRDRGEIDRTIKSFLARLEAAG
jgi:D-alanine-D-alanine ligase